MDLSKLAAELRAAYADDTAAAEGVLRRLYAQRVVLAHHPEAAEGDGERDGAALAELHVCDAETLAAAMSDFRHDDVVVTVTESTLEVRSTLRGTLRDGTSMSVPLRLAYGFKDDRITRIDAHLDHMRDDQRSTLSMTLGGVAVGEAG